MATCGKLFVSLAIIATLVFLVSGQPIADTKYGQVQGVYSDTEQEGLKVTYFRGIKYTEPMVGDLRFELPVEIKPWAPDIYDATVFGPSCPQTLNVPEWMQTALPNTDLSEDCLLLNIYVPGHNLPAPNTHPVMVWIHGGGFDIGQGMLYESTALAGIHGVIVVTINYRLGTFGFLSTGDEYSPGNYGLHDQIMSLEWVQENIANFGGDPNLVTIFGESAGGISTGVLAHSPKAVGLFHRVIGQSGVYHPGFIASTERATEFAYNVGYSANCNTTENPDLTDHDLLIECLRDLTWEQLLYAQIDAVIITTPVEDGDIIPDVQAIYESEKFKEYDYLAGTNSWEASLIANNVDQLDDGLLNDIAFQAMIKAEVEVFFDDHHDLISDAAYHKYTAWYQQDDDAVRLDRLKNFFNELSFLSPAVAQLREHSRRTLIPPSPPETNSYHYYFDHRPSFYKGPFYIDGAAHATEIPFTFGHVLMTGNGPFENLTVTEAEKQLGLDMSRYWTNFAKTGDPNLPIAVPVQWPLYDNTLYTYMRFEPNMTDDNVRENLRADGTGFWNEYVPNLLNLTCPVTAPCSQSTDSGAMFSFNLSEDEVDSAINGLFVACLCLSVVSISLAVALVVVIKSKPRRRADDQVQLTPNNKKATF